MRHKKLTKAAAIGLSVIMAAGGSFTALATPDVKGAEPAPLQAVGLPSPILVTEMVPNTENMNSSDAYEYFEITNVSGVDVDLRNYDIVYDNGNTKTVWTTDVTVLPAGQTILVWVKNPGNQELTKEDFRTFYSLDPGALVAETQCGGMANSGRRSMSIATKTGKTLCTVTYAPADSEDGKLGIGESIVFSYDGDQITVSYDNEVTPLQLPAINGGFTSPAKVDSPSVTASGRNVLNPGESLAISVGETNLDPNGIVSGSIQVEGGRAYPLTYDENGSLSAQIPYNDVQDMRSFQYTLTIFDGVNTAVSASNTVTVTAAGSEIDVTKAPALVVTELAPDTANIGGSDAWEFIEIYNNSSRDIDLKDYRLYYYYPDNGNNALWWNTTESKF